MTTTPPPRSIMPGRTARQVLKTPRTLTAKTASHSSGGVSTTVCVEPMPATLASTSTAPASVSTRATAASTAARSVTSPVSAIVSSPSSATSRPSAASSRSKAAIRSPRACSSSAVARPMPEPALPAGAKDPRVALGERVNTLRVAQGLSQEEFAGRVGLDRTYVSGIERGLRNPTLLVLLRLAQALEVSLTELLEEPPGRKGQRPQPAKR